MPNTNQTVVNFAYARLFGFCPDGIKQFCKSNQLSVKVNYSREYLDLIIQRNHTANEKYIRELERMGFSLPLPPVYCMDCHCSITENEGLPGDSGGYYCEDCYFSHSCPACDSWHNDTNDIHYNQFTYESHCSDCRDKDSGCMECFPIPDVTLTDEQGRDSRDYWQGFLNGQPAYFHAVQYGYNPEQRELFSNAPKSKLDLELLTQLIQYRSYLTA